MCCRRMPGCCLGLTAFSLILAVAVFMGGPDAHRARCAGGGSDASWNPYTRPARGSDTAAVCTSSYVTMRDGVKIAVDVCLPSDLAPGERLPAIVHQTRYFRSIQLSGPFGLFGTRVNVHYPVIRPYIVEHGYAWVDVDARGSGASFGNRSTAFSPEEIQDGYEILDWLVAQEWSDGRTVSFGVSYDGIAAETLTSLGHPSMKGAAILFSPFDLYTEYVLPGGVRLSWFTKVWGALNALLDNNRIHRVIGLPDWATSILSLSVHPVETEDADGSMLRAAVAEHSANWDVHRAASQVSAHDDLPPSMPRDMRAVSPYSRFDGLASAAENGAYIMAASGWLDGANANAAIKRFRALKARGVPPSRNAITLGAFQHAGGFSMVTGGYAVETCHDNKREVLRFFDGVTDWPGADGGAAGGGREAWERDASVRYFTVGREQWSFTSDWPPPESEMLPMALGSGNSLVPGPVQAALTAEAGEAGAAAACDGAEGGCEQGSDDIPFGRLGTGSVTRWNSLVFAEKASNYRPRYAHLPLPQLEYTGPVLSEPLEVTGWPVVDVTVAFSCPYAALFAYLEDVAPNGRATHVTEGQLNASFPTFATPEAQEQHNKAAAARGEEPWPPLPALYDGGVPGHPYRNFTRGSILPLTPNEPRRLRFPLLPVSYQFGVGHAVRLTLRLADVDLFQEACATAGAIRAHQCAAPGEELSATSTTNPVTSVTDGGSGAKVDRVWADDATTDDCDDDEAAAGGASDAPATPAGSASESSGEGQVEAVVASDGATRVRVDAHASSDAAPQASGTPVHEAAAVAAAPKQPPTSTAPSHTAAVATNSATVLRGRRPRDGVRGGQDSDASAGAGRTAPAAAIAMPVLSVSRIELPIIRRSS